MSITAIVYVLAYFAGIFKCLAGKPHFGMYTYLFAVYAHAPGRWWGEALPNLRWSMLAGLVTLLSVLIYNKKDTKFLSSTEMKLFLAFVIWVWLQNFWSIGTRHSEFTFLVTKFLLLMYLIHATIDDEKKLVTFLVVNLAGCAYFGWIGFTQHTSGRFENVGTPGMDDGNLLSIHMAPILITGSYLLLCDLGKKKYLLIPAIGLVLNGILLTQSRGGLAAMAAAGLFSILFVTKRTRKMYYKYVLLALISVVSLMGPELVSRIQSVTAAEDAEEVDKSAYSRIVVIQAQIEMFKLNPVMGQGHKGTLYLSPDYISQEFMTGKEGSRRRASHNLIMTLLVDHGIIGTILYLGIFAVILKKLVTKRKMLVSLDSNLPTIYISCIMALVCVHVASLFSNSMKLEVDIWYFALLAILYRWIMEEYETKQASQNTVAANVANTGVPDDGEREKKAGKSTETSQLIGPENPPPPDNEK